MHIRTGLVLVLCVAVPSSSFADFRYDETTKLTRGSLVSVAKFAGACSKQAHQITDPVNSTILVRGNRMAHIDRETDQDWPAKAPQCACRTRNGRVLGAGDEAPSTCSRPARAIGSRPTCSFFRGQRSG
jgi:hypothetical protein